MSGDFLTGTVTAYDGEYITLRVPFANRDFMIDHNVRTALVSLDDGVSISSKQNKAIHATFRDIGEYTGNPEELTKETLKVMYAKQKGCHYFSLAELTMTQAGEFLDWMLEWCMTNDIPISEKLSARCDDIARIMYACVMHKRCAVCGAASDLHHVDALGMGADRTEAHHGMRRVMALCRVHHGEAHTIGNAAFCEKYKLTPVKADKKICRKYGLKF